MQHLLTASQLPNVHVQVLPFRAGSHACIAGSFSIVSFAETEAMDVVHVDSIAATESAMYRTFFERTARLSLAPRDSLSLIETISEDMHR
ncbi:Scr1 family TA system antitoxin-like transcriptional regulator [Streptomyces sp. NPDC020607]|uniref:Scr1 family TA system antitoxin-like transcriptional regulator n=1 Tax=Streptomyces sp. NPDC020607 TaxID=3365082 RepID=UPI0037AD0EDA